MTLKRTVLRQCLVRTVNPFIFSHVDLILPDGIVFGEVDFIYVNEDLLILELGFRIFTGVARDGGVVGVFDGDETNVVGGEETGLGLEAGEEDDGYL
ncbi:hypothetical protein CCACVL1_25634 [Corchorus capsularis]|uniref:Uncharacterized protein n=1 Tax=Corchorus capsularis TaxID=210143 RepID=A0A1R3GIR0_COCAP|nr:hypothetical protein CCACVL1_25634 [Corchorus capsularis]